MLAITDITSGLYTVFGLVVVGAIVGVAAVHWLFS